MPYALNPGTLTPNSEVERERLIREHAPLVKYIAQRLAMKLPPHIGIDDLISNGVLGLLDAVDKYDPARNVKFSTYAQFRIKGAMLDSLREMDWVPRSARDKGEEIARLYEALERKLGRPATEEEAAEEMGLSVDEFMEMLGGINGAAILSIDDLSAFTDGEAAGRQDGVNPQAVLAEKELKEFMGKAIDGLPEKERLVVTLYYYEELTMKEVGAVLNLTESRVCQLHAQAVLRLKGRLKRGVYG
jgi:RNA polymerase sigma factor for flagellar operon FliA